MFSLLEINSQSNLCFNANFQNLGISALTVDTVETYRDGVCKTCDAVDGNIKSMYQVRIIEI